MPDDGEPDSQFTPAELARLQKVKTETEHGLRDERKLLSDQDRVLKLLSIGGPFQIEKDQDWKLLPKTEEGQAVKEARRIRETARKKLRNEKFEGRLSSDKSLRIFGELVQTEMDIRETLRDDPDAKEFEVKSKKTGEVLERRRVRTIDLPHGRLFLELNMRSDIGETLKVDYRELTNSPASGVPRIVGTNVNFMEDGTIMASQGRKEFDTEDVTRQSFVIKQGVKTINKQAVNIIAEVLDPIQTYLQQMSVEIPQFQN